MRAMAIIIVILGVASLVFGILFTTQAASAEQEIADSVSPLTLDEIEPKYDVVATKYTALKTAEEPGIQGQTAQPSPSYNYLAAQRALLGLAKANMGVASFVRTTGVVNILVGLGLVLAGLTLLRHAHST
jgi:hypothetical protein